MVGHEPQGIDQYAIQNGTALPCVPYWSPADPADPSGPVVAEHRKIAGDDSEYLVDRLSGFLNTTVAAGDPFLAVVWFHAVHQIFEATPKWKGLYAGRQQDEQDYFGVVSALDHQIGRIRRTLVDLGIADDTAVFFCSDNGPEHLTPGSTQIDPGLFLRGRKRDVTEGGIRVPGLIEWPSKIRQNHRTSHVASTVDYLPTIADVLGVPPPAGHILDGVSLLPVISSAHPKNLARKKSIGVATISRFTPSTPPHFEVGPATAAVVVTTVAQAGDLLGFSVGSDTLIDQDMKILGRRLGDGTFNYSVYNISADPSETVDLSTVDPAEATRLLVALETWRASVNVSVNTGCAIRTYQFWRSAVNLSLADPASEPGVELLGEFGSSVGCLTACAAARRCTGLTHVGTNVSLVTSPVFGPWTAQPSASAGKCCMRTDGLWPVHGQQQSACARYPPIT
jgi:hypothetical protein